ncbi:hypothetical protein [Streptomyces albus]|uniref:hypothetical protein n=1 Tax=Streptomyces albus TaxID=1888 RepID=UPI003D0D6B6E
MGTSGCGRTTAPRLVAGFGAADFGELLMDGEDVTAIPAKRRDIGRAVFQVYSSRMRRSPSGRTRPARGSIITAVMNGLPGVVTDDATGEGATVRVATFFGGSPGRSRCAAPGSS